jgi:hypothetical protein
MRLSSVSCAAAMIVAAGLLTGSAQGQLPGVEPLHDSGQDVTPSFEGWFPNGDGTFSLSFGYMNRNLKEVVDIAIGPNNRMEPGGPDRGQPTHFLARRNMGVFTVTVPKDFGRQRLTWTLNRNGRANSTTGHLDDRWRIDVTEEVTIKNEAPVIRFEAGGASAMGTRPIVRSTTVAFPGPVTLDVFATDNEPPPPPPLPGRTARPREPVLTTTWQKYRGPGTVTFAAARPTIDPATARSTTTATFSEPGEYWLRVVTNDGSGPTGGAGQCCWTNGLVKVTVTIK